MTAQKLLVSLDEIAIEHHLREIQMQQDVRDSLDDHMTCKTYFNATYLRQQRPLLPMT
jgi:hypothetical protein